MTVRKEISLPHEALDVAMHPCKPILAAGTVNGDVRIFSYMWEEDISIQKLMVFKNVDRSCRTVDFSTNGDCLFAGSGDNSVYGIDLNAGAVTKRLCIADGAPIYSVLSINEYLLAVGDDDGRLIVWDFRHKFPVMSLKPCEDYISDLVICDNTKVLLATSGDATLSAFNMRGMKLENQSEYFDDEFTSLAIMKEGTKVIVGASDGAFNIFNWGEWGNISDRYPVTSNPVNSLVPLSDDVLLVACGDGNVRAVSIFPNRVIGLIGNHNTVTAERLSLSYDKQFVATCSIDNIVKLHGVPCFSDIDAKPNMKSSKAKKFFNSEENKFFEALA